jgi:glutaredoxin-related protein
MFTRIQFASVLTMLLSAMTFQGLACAQQNPPAAVATISVDTANRAAREQILQSERWRNAVRGFEQWLSVQQLYTPQEVAVLRAQFKSRVDRMSPAELQEQLTRMEEKLAVLSSPEAEDARRWLAQFLAVQAKYTDEQLRQMRPDVARMTAAQIRDELRRFQARRGEAQMGQSAAQQARTLQVQSAQSVQAARSQAQQSASTAATFAQPSQPPRQQTIPVPVISAPVYTVGPWGNPIRWDARAGFW